MKYSKIAASINLTVGLVLFCFYILNLDIDNGFELVNATCNLILSILFIALAKDEFRRCES